MMRDTCSPKEYPCPLCGQCSCTRRQSKIHMIKAHNTKDLQFQLRNWHSCSCCGKKFSRKKRLELHIKKHDKDEKLNIQKSDTGIEDAEKKFGIVNPDSAPEDEKSLRIQAQRYSSEKSMTVPKVEPVVTLSCSEVSDGVANSVQGYNKCHCGKYCSLKGGLKMHRSKCRVRSWPSCPKCGESFPSKDRSKRHVKTHKRDKELDKQKGDTEKMQDNCGQLYSSKKALKTRIHTTENLQCQLRTRHLCPQCGKRFSRKIILTNHIRTHDEEKELHSRKCDKIKVEDVENVAMRIGIVIPYSTSENEEVQQYSPEKSTIASAEHVTVSSCPEVGETVSNSTQNSLGTHASKNPQRQLRSRHSCTQCGKHFSRKRLLKNHTRTHNIKKELNVQKCDKKKVGDAENIAMRKGIIIPYSAPENKESPQKEEQIYSSEKSTSVPLVELAKFVSSCPEISGSLSNFAQDSYPCPICGQCYFSKRALETHTCIHTTESLQCQLKSRLKKSEIPCSHCGKHFSKRMLEKHTKTRHRDKKINAQKDDTMKMEVDFVAARIGIVVPYLGPENEGEMQEYLGESTPVRTVQSCPEVSNEDSKITQDSDLQLELQNCNSENNAVAPAHSGKIKVPSIKVEIRESDSENEIYPCMLCSDEFPTDRELKVHMKTHIGNSMWQNILSCPHCEEQFITKYVLDRHIKKEHTGDRPFQCLECNRTFIERYRLKNHVLVHCKKPRSSTRCGIGFSQ